MSVDLKDRFNKLVVVHQASDQWERVAVWLRSRESVNQNHPQARMIFFSFWLLAALWRVAIAMALLICLVLEGVNFLLRPLARVADAILGWLLLPLMAPIELALTLPYVGRLVGLLWRVILTIGWAALHLLEAPLILLSVMPSRRLRLWIVPQNPAEGDGIDSHAKWLQALEITDRILRREANVHLAPIVPWESGAGLLASEFSMDRFEWLRELEAEATKNPLDVSCNMQALSEDLGALGGQIGRLALLGHPRGAYRRLSGWGAPIMALSVESVDSGALAGCSLGPLTDYITVRDDQPVCLAHEIGHACNLFHHQSSDNLMNPTCGGVHLSRWQVLLLRLSRHVTYL